RAPEWITPMTKRMHQHMPHQQRRKDSSIGNINYEEEALA
ncbi:10570_t:CDS:1, partial [Gigaspora rosea]